MGLSSSLLSVHDDALHQGSGSVVLHAGVNVSASVHPNAERQFPDSVFLSIDLSW